MKRTFIVISFLLCFVIIIVLGGILIDWNENRNQNEQTIDSLFMRDLSRFASSLLPAENMDNYETERVERYKIESSRYIYGAVELFSLSSYRDCENLYTLISGLYYLSQIDKLQFAIAEEDIKDLMYLSAHAFDRELVESLSGELVGRIKPFEYSLNT